MSCAADLGGSSIDSYSSSEGRGGMGSMWTAFGHGFADHEMYECSVQVRFAVMYEMNQDERSQEVLIAICMVCLH